VRDELFDLVEVVFGEYQFEGLEYDFLLFFRQLDELADFQSAVEEQGDHYVDARPTG
jgi:hypothetical protein